MDYLTVYAMFKRETPWLAEWIEYHRLMGVERFHLFDAEPSFEADLILRPYVARGLVRHDRSGGFGFGNQTSLYSA